MRIAVGKKKLITLIVIVITLVIALSLLLYFFRDRINFNLSSENKVSGDYNNVIAECSSASEDSGTNYTCYAFIESVTDEGSRKCFNFSLITKDYRIKPLVYCYEKDEIEWNPEIMISWRAVPVSINFLYSKSIFGVDSLQKITLEILEDNLILDLVGKLYDNGYIVSNLWTKNVWESEQKGYYTQMLSGEFFDGKVEGITFLSSKVKGIEILDTLYKLEIETRINKERVLMSMTTKNLYLLDSHSSELIPKKVAEGLDLSGTYDISAFYIPSGNDINNLCTGLTEENFSRIAFCENLMDRNLAEIEISIDTYLSELSKNNLNNVDKFIPYLLINIL